MADLQSQQSPKHGSKHLPTPTERVYVHTRCGGQTIVNEGDFTRVCDAFWYLPVMYCAACQRQVSTRDVRWADNMESIVKYRRRVRRKTPTPLRVWRSGLGFAIGGVVGLVFGIVRAIANNRQDNFLMQALFGVLVGGVSLQFVGTFVLSQIYRFDYRRVR